MEKGSTLVSVSEGYSYYKGTFGIGNYFIINFPNDWPTEEQYGFNWSELSEKEDRFQKINYNEF